MIGFQVRAVVGAEFDDSGWIQGSEEKIVKGWAPTRKAAEDLMDQMYEEHEEAWVRLV